MCCDQLFATIDALNGQYLRFWEDICNIESPTDHKEGVDRVSAYFAEKAKEKGWKCEWHREAVSGDVLCITMNPDAAGAPIVCSGHLDTVHPVGSFGTPAVRIEGDRMYGPGVFDCKGGTVAAFMAMDALAQNGFSGRPVKLILQSDEENGSRFSEKRTVSYICEQARDAVAFFNMEGGNPGKATVGRKGILNYRFEITGVEAHSSQCAKEGASAIAQAAHMIIELEKFKDDAGLTCNCGIIEGGTVPNTVAGRCTFVANIRFASQAQYDEIRAFCEKLAKTVYVEGCTCRLVLQSHRTAMEVTDRNLSLLEKVNGIWAENGLQTRTAATRKGGSDAADITAFGIPVLDSVGVLGGKIHSPDEFAELSSLAESAKYIAAAVYCI